MLPSQHTLVISKDIFSCYNYEDTIGISWVEARGTQDSSPIRKNYLAHVVITVQQCKCTYYHCILENDYDGKVCYVYLPQLKNNYLTQNVHSAKVEKPSPKLALVCIISFNSHNPVQFNAHFPEGQTEVQVGHRVTA